MNKLNISALSLAAAQLASIGFTSNVVLMSQGVPPDLSADAPPTTPVDVTKAVIPVSYDNTTRYLAVVDVSEDGKAATFSILDSHRAVYDFLGAPGDLHVADDPITLEQLMAGDIKDAAKVLEFELAQVA